MSQNKPHYTAAVDVGSNSFHMIVAEVRNGQLQIVDRLREMVQLAAGLDEQLNLTPEAQARTISCLQRFGQRLEGIPGNRVRAVGTNALRQARNAPDFLDAAEAALGHPLEIISGQEEARLIYLGVSHDSVDSTGRQLVIDIGGGSTELIIGQQHTPLLTESLLLGCISFTQKYFGDGLITQERVDKAQQDAALEMAAVEGAYRALGWQRGVGSSGTIRALAELAHTHGFCSEGTITRTALNQLLERLLIAGDPSSVDQASFRSKRLSVLPGGLCILLTMMERLELETLHLSNQALREGLLYDLFDQL